MTTLKQVERSNQIKKHLKILKDVCKAPNDVIKFGDTIRLNVALAAMQVLQDEIDGQETLKELLVEQRWLLQNMCDHPYHSVMGEDELARCLRCSYKFGLSKEENKQLLTDEVNKITKK